ncbi:T9SS type A sorting domain-containing protein [Kaistella carnis]|uniref:T9SS C-terminal target domain-containing protein n=1 Tax=Kaistella carnis TaxID=1241979 RepID=A0A3G8XI14_9FLAO|nr:T9SS type A sorting domain-containing protein [Kaistella carnis]AZI33032.1 T9SS C-terminal target domain-containing protein [Kaistella carnis]
MKRNLLTVGLLTAFFAVNAQMTTDPKVLSHIDDNATFYVGKGALVYNGGGLQVKDTGILENHGNIMIVANDPAKDVLRTLNGTSDKVEGSTVGGTIVNKLNEPTAYATWNTNSSTATPAYTYGQLYIQGISQDNIKGIVNQEFRSPNHGGYQEFSVPFFGKTASTLSAELGKTFNTTRWLQNEILVWNNDKIVFDNLSSISEVLGTNTRAPFSYYILGGKNLDVASVTRTVRGVPVSDLTNNSRTLSGAGAGIVYGTNGTAINQYNERYNTYLGDNFARTRNKIWDGTDYGKNMYFFTNPYLTNLDLRNLNVLTDVNYIPNINGIRLEPTNVQYQPGVGGSIVGFKYVTNSNGVWTGDTDYLLVRPMGTFVIKLLDNSQTPTLDLSKLRRFNYYSRDTSTPYTVTANRGQANGTVKELAIIGLNSSGGEVARMYYVVYPEGISGNSVNVKGQAAAGSTSLLGSYEENPVSGGYDNNYTNSYWLYINEANENDFKGKNIKMVKYSNDIVSFKVQLKENGSLVSDGQHLLSTNEGFYFKGPDGNVQSLSQNMVLPSAGSSNQDYDVYYGLPSGVLGSDQSTVPSRTMISYDPYIGKYVVIFDPNWKKADVQVYDMSGKLVISSKGINTTSNYEIDLVQNVKNVYFVKVVSEKGVTVQSKIIK